MEIYRNVLNSTEYGKFVNRNLNSTQLSPQISYKIYYKNYIDCFVKGSNFSLDGATYNVQG